METATKLAANIASPLAAIREDLGVLVVLDSNAFNGDLRADRSRLRSVLDGAVAKGIFELYVPEVVLQELDKQFTVRSKKVVGEINQALGEQEEQLLELGLSGPDEMVYDKTGAAEYRSTLEKRLKLAGARILTAVAQPKLLCAHVIGLHRFDASWRFRVAEAPYASGMHR